METQERAESRRWLDALTDPDARRLPEFADARERARATMAAVALDVLAEVAERCALAGLLVTPGDEWFPTEPTGPFLRLNYAGPHPARFEVGIRILAGVLG